MKKQIRVGRRNTMGYKRLLDYEFDFKTYIAKRLREIDDIEERKFAKTILEDGLIEIIEHTEAKYKNLEDEVFEEYACPGKQTEIYTTVIQRNDEDLKNGFLYEVNEHRHHFEQKLCSSSFYYEAASDACTQLATSNRVFSGKIISGENITQAKFKLRRSKHLISSADRLYKLYMENNIPWTTLNLSYFFKFFECVPERESSILYEGINETYEVDLEELTPHVRWDLIAVWNVESLPVASSDFMIPCTDEELAWEHKISLKEYGEKDCYLVHRQPGILASKQDGDDFIIRSLEQELPKLQMIRIAAPRTLARGYHAFPLLSNAKRDSFTRRFLSHTGTNLQTETDIIRKINEFDLCHLIRYTGSQVINDVNYPSLCYSMNPFMEEMLFDSGNRRVLLLTFQQGEVPDWLAMDLVSFVVSEIQLNVPSFRCEGILVSK